MARKVYDVVDDLIVIPSCNSEQLEQPDASELRQLILDLVEADLEGSDTNPIIEYPMEFGKYKIFHIDIPPGLFCFVKSGLVEAVFPMETQYELSALHFKAERTSKLTLTAIGDEEVTLFAINNKFESI